MVINHANFPPLHAEEGVETAEIVEQQGVGYPGEYKKYSIDDIINIVKNIKDATPLPENIKPVKFAFMCKLYYIADDEN